ncbi:MAG: lipid-A-disaccharide synthase [Desulfatiglandaceae bacterium]
MELKSDGSRPVSAGRFPLECEVFLVAGEASGDLHGSNLVRALKRIRPETTFSGVGGPRMREAGVDIIVSSSKIAVVGLTEVFKKIPIILTALKTVKHAIKEKRPSLVILIDFPDFNLNVAKYARRSGVPVLYFISPQVWAWRKGRIRTIARRVNKMAVILPFERDFYAKCGVPVSYVGHPLLDVCPPVENRSEAAQKLGLGTEGPLIGLLPGSRSEEIRNMMPAMTGAARMLLNRYPSARFVLPLAPGVEMEFITKFIPRGLPMEIHSKNLYKYLNACDAAMVASGTATLEAALMETPMVIVYKVSGLSYRVGRLVIKTPAIGLANLVAGEKYFTELIQHELTPARLYSEIVSMLEEPSVRSRIRKGLSRVRLRLGESGALERTAALAASMIKSRVDDG